MCNVLKADVQYAIRMHNEEEHEYRCKFERDRDRIFYSKAFRRLSGKTQVFVAGCDDHIRTRLTHTLEVMQIATTVSKNLGLNIPLTEAIAYGHDLGHTPFGHVGERTLNYIMNGCYSIKGVNKCLDHNEQGFKHNLQSVKVISELEALSRNYYGLNPTNYTLWGVLNHSSLKYDSCERKTESNKCNLLLQGVKCKKIDEKLSLSYYDKYIDTIGDDSWTIEALVVAAADEIAQRHHDIEDGIEAGIIDKDELLRKFHFQFREYLSESEIKIIKNIEVEKEKNFYSSMFSKLMINFLTTKLIKDTSINLTKLIANYNITGPDDFYNKRKDIKANVNISNLVKYSGDFRLQEKKFQKYLKTRILNSYTTQKMDGKAAYIIVKLFKAYITNPQQLPDKTIETLFRVMLTTNKYKNLVEELSKAETYGVLREELDKEHYRELNPPYKSVLLRVITDYISGMTDKYALDQYKALYQG